MYEGERWRSTDINHIFYGYLILFSCSILPCEASRSLTMWFLLPAYVLLDLATGDHHHRGEIIQFSEQVDELTSVDPDIRIQGELRLCRPHSRRYSSVSSQSVTLLHFPAPLTSLPQLYLSPIVPAIQLV